MEHVYFLRILNTKQQRHFGVRLGCDPCLGLGVCFFLYVWSRVQWLKKAQDDPEIFNVTKWSTVAYLPQIIHPQTLPRLLHILLPTRLGRMRTSLGRVDQTFFGQWTLACRTCSLELNQLSRRRPRSVWEEMWRRWRWTGPKMLYDAVTGDLVLEGWNSHFQFVDSLVSTSGAFAISLRLERNEALNTQLVVTRHDVVSPRIPKNCHKNRKQSEKDIELVQKCWWCFNAWPSRRRNKDI